MSEKEIAQKLFQTLQQTFPSLEMQIGNEPQVEIAFYIPEQPGMKFSLHSNLQGDELHLHAAGLWLTWFPFDKEDRQKDFLDICTGIISGKYRIRQTLRGDRVVTAEVQKEESGQWSTFTGSSSWGLPIPWKKTIREIRNA